MKKLSLSMFALSLVLLISLPALAQTNYWFERDGEPIFYITLPASWEGEWQEEDGLSVLHAIAANETAYLSVWALHDVEDLEDASEAVGEMLDEWVNGFDSGEWEEGEINDIPVIYTDGTAVDIETDEPLDLSIAFFIPEEGQVFILIVVGEQAYRDEHSGDIQSILQSIQRG